MQTDMELFQNLIDSLPSFVTSFFIKKNDSYQIRTKLAYARDIRNFLLWVLESTDYSDALNVKGITTAEMNKITDEDIDMYLLYLSQYKDVSRGGRSQSVNREDMLLRSNGALSKRRKLSSIHNLFKFLLKTGKIDSDPMVLTEKPKVRADKTIFTLSDSQKEMLINAAYEGKCPSLAKTDEVGKVMLQTERGRKLQETKRKETRYRDSAILSLFLSTGIRVAELCAIDMRDIDFTEQSVFVTRKGGANDLVYFNNETLELLIRYITEERNLLLGLSFDEESEADVFDARENALAFINDDSPLFIARGRKRITIRRIQQIVKEYSEFIGATNIKISPHTLRKTFGTEVYRKFRDLTLAQNALGHKNSSTTSKYYVEFDKDRLKVLRGN